MFHEITSWFRRHQTGAVLLGILLVAAALRFPRLTQHDVIDDEALMAFRSIGWMDTWFGSMKSPVDLFPTEQWWQKLSFHDHPPLTFLAEHWSFRLFGVTILALRLPFALAGLLVVFLSFQVGRRLFSDRVGLFAAAVAAVANYPVWLSRVGFQEGLLLVWLLAALWFFLRSLDDRRSCLWLGVAVGLAFLTKYSAVVIVPVVVGGYLLLRPQALKTSWPWWGAATSLLLVSPVIVYNAMLYRARGHFDATLWAMLGQRHQDFWSDDHAYSTWASAFNWVQWVPAGFGWLLSALAAAGAVLLVVSVWRQRPLIVSRAAGWAISSLLLTTLVFLSLSPGRKQYAALLTIPAVLLSGAALATLASRRFGLAIAVGVVGMLGLITVNTQLNVVPYGQPPWASLTLRPTSYAYRQLDDYLDKLFANQPPSLQLTQDRQVAAATRARLERRFGPNPIFRSRPPFIIWDERLDFAAVRWTMFRRDIYHFQPTLSTHKVVEGLRANGKNFLDQAGFTNFTFVFLEPPYLSPAQAHDDSYAVQLREILERRGARPMSVIRDLQGRAAFAVYRTSTLQFFTIEEPEPEMPAAPSG